MFYHLCCSLGRIWLKITGCRVLGRENIPENQAVLVIANHISYGDPVVLGSVFPQTITFIAKEGFSRKWFTKWLFSKLGAVFLNKTESDLTALRTAIKFLKNGRTVAIFPEGRRNRDPELAVFMPGATYIAHKARVPIIPVGIQNSQDLIRFWKKNKIVNVGKPIWLDFDEKATHEYLAAQSAELRAAVAVLLTENQHLLRAAVEK